MKKIFATILVAFCFVLTLVACGQKETQVTFIVDNEVYKVVELSEAKFVTAPEKNGYYFVGWFLDNGSFQQPFDASKTKEDCSVYAKFEEIQITFMVDDEVYATEKISNIDSVTAPNKEDCAFAGWFFDKDSFQQPFDVSKVKDNCTVYAKLIKHEKYVFTFNDYEIYGIEKTQTYYGQSTVDLPKIECDKNFLGWLTEDGKGPFTQIYVEKDMTLTPVFSNLDTIYIDTNGVAITSKEDYVQATFTMRDKNGDIVKDFKDISTGIRLRGNSTFNYDKKPYRIKFNKKQALIGETKYKSWVLLADMLDPTLMKNYSAHYLASQMDGIDVQVRIKHVQVVVNGVEMGTYLLTDQVQVQPEGSEGRIPIEIDEVELASMTEIPFLLERDFWMEGVQNKNWFAYTYKNREHKIQIKYPEEPTEAQFEYIYNTYDSIFKLFGELAEANEIDRPAIRAEIEKFVDIDSMIDYFLVVQIMYDTDNQGSTYMYYDLEKFRFGPVWDFDNSLNYMLHTEDRFAKVYTYATKELNISHEWYGIIRADSVYNEMLCNRFLSAGTNAINNLIANADIHFDEMYYDGMRNIIVWSDAKINVFHQFYKNYGEYSTAKEFIITWFTKRLEFLTMLYG